MLSPTIAVAAATTITSGSHSFPCEARIEAVIRAVSPGSGMPADSPPISSASRTYAIRVAGRERKRSAFTWSAASLERGATILRRALVHLPQLQAALGRHRRRRRLLGAGAAVPPLRLRLPVRAHGRLLPGSERGVRRLRRGRADPRRRPRRLRADRLPGEGRAREGRDGGVLTGRLGRRQEPFAALPRVGRAPARREARATDPERAHPGRDRGLLPGVRRGRRAPGRVVAAPELQVTQCY